MSSPLTLTIASGEYRILSDDKGHRLDTFGGLRMFSKSPFPPPLKDGSLVLPIVVYHDKADRPGVDLGIARG